jgi:hypothetical protein
MLLQWIWNPRFLRPLSEKTKSDRMRLGGINNILATKEYLFLLTHIHRSWSCPAVCKLEPLYSLSKEATAKRL